MAAMAAAWAYAMAMLAVGVVAQVPQSSASAATTPAAAANPFKDMMQSAVPVNPCDNVAVSTPYYIGYLAVAAANCTSQCPPSTYQDTNQVCHECKIVGCETCGGGEGDVCKDCLIFHMRAGGQCLYLFGGMFFATVLFTLVFFLFGVLRFCVCGLCSAQNANVLREVLKHRNRAKAHVYDLPGNPAPSYDRTNVRRTNISGIGPMLYFRYVSFLILLSGCLVVGEGGLLIFKEYLYSSFAQTTSWSFTEMCFAIALYYVCFLFFIIWVTYQNHEVVRDITEGAHLRNYALVAQGFPKTAQSPLEVKAFFESILSFEVEGVSIAYDYIEEADFVEDRVSQAVEKADTHLGLYPSELSSAQSYSSDSQDSYVVKGLQCSGYAFLVFCKEEERQFCIRRFNEIDKEIERSGNKVANDEESDDDDESSALLGGGPTRRGRGPRSRSSNGPSSAVLYLGKYAIQVGPAPEPCGIQWHNFAVRRGAKAVRIIVAVLMALLLVLLISGVIFSPAYLAAMSYINMAAQGVATKNQTIFIELELAAVSMSIAVNNRLLMAGLRWAAQISGFLQKVNEDTAFLVCSLPTVLISSSAPLVTAAIWANSSSTKLTSELIVKVLFQILWMTMLVTEVAGYLLPSWSYWNSFFWIRMNTYVSVREGEPRLLPDEFKLSTRYVDMLLVFTIACSMISVSSRSLYSVAGQCLLFLYFTYIYFSDKYVFLRVARQTHYTSPKLDAAALYLMVLPFAALFVYPLKLVAGDLPQAPWEWDDRWEYLIIFICNSIFFLAMVRLCQWCYQAEREESNMPYTEVASQIPYNYFNTNPVHVLRSLHFPSIMAPPIYPHRPGKEYLQGGQFSDYNYDVKLRETLLLLAKSPLKGMDDFGNPQDFR